MGCGWLEIVPEWTGVVAAPSKITHKHLCTETSRELMLLISQLAGSAAAAAQRSSSVLRYLSKQIALASRAAHTRDL